MRYFWLSGLLSLVTGACTSLAERPGVAPVRIRWEHDPQSLDPMALPTQHTVDATNLLHLGLLQVDFQTKRFAPALAETLPQVSLVGDSLTRLTYRLRPAATWDDGHPVLAADVACTLKMMRSPGLPNEVVRAQLSFIQALEPDPADPRRFTLVCRGQAPEYALEASDFAVLPEATLDPEHRLRPFKLAELATAPVAVSALQALAQRYRQADPAHHPERLPGCGPYRLTSWQPNRSLVFQRKDHWWADQLRPAPLVLQATSTQLQYSILPDEASATLALRRHEIDLYPQMAASSFQRLQATDAERHEFTFHTTASHDLVTVGFNTQLPLLHDKCTRQALSYLLDPAGLLAGTQRGQGRRTVGLLPPDSPFYNDSLLLLSYAPARATELLRQAGWQQTATGWQRRVTGSVQQLKLTVRYRADEPTFATVALQLRTAAAALGIPVELAPTEQALLTPMLRQGNYEVYVRTLRGNPFGYNFAPILHSRGVGKGNLTRFSSPATDRLLDAITAAGPARKRQLLRRFQAAIQDETPLVPLFFLSYRLVADRHLGHLLPTGLKPGFAATTLTWDGALAAPTR
ncbi:MAG: ABC transporter substrate-binding protein [Janthinobacterium lividum]